MDTIRIANAPCSWGALEFDPSAHERLSGTSPSGERVLAEMREAGYAATELGDWGFLPTQPEELRHLLDAHDLPLLGAFVPVALAHPEAHAAGIDEACKVGSLLAALNEEAFVVLADANGSDSERTRCAGRIELHQSLGPDRWDVFAGGATAVAEAVRERCGLRTAFHFHCAGFVETATEVDALLRRTDPELLGLCFDTGHWTYGGGDPVEGLRKHADRIWHVHFKDCHPEVAFEARRQGWDYFEAVGRGVFCELGQGAVDFPGVVDELRRQGYHGWAVVEQDVLPGLGTPLESARRNRQYLQTLGL